MSFGKNVLDFHFGLKPKRKLPGQVEWIYPYANEDTQSSMHSFFNTFYKDSNPRIFLLGINPGRFGAGVTGVPFTDPIRLENECGIKNPFSKRAELSSIFVYEVIQAMGGIRSFCQHFYITSVCPLGFVKAGKNYNYYDDKKLETAVLPFIKRNIKSQKKFGAHPIAFSMGQGKNFKFLKNLNDKEKYFDKIIPLPHPRWVMQYKLKTKEQYIDEYVMKLNSVMKSE